MKVLSKSRFKLGLECPNKLYYTDNPEYANSKKDDPFLQALAQGGFQVEEFARMHFPGGVLIESENRDYYYLAQVTSDLMSQENVIIYEAAFYADSLFVRSDIIVKNGNNLKLIEVKSKSFDPKEEQPFLNQKTKNTLVAKWKAYLHDIAFQKHVIQLCYPELQIQSYLLMADKTAKATVNGLNQMFRISQKSGDRTGIIKSCTDISELGESVLTLQNIDEIIDLIEQEDYECIEGHNLKASIQLLSNIYQSKSYPSWPTSFSACKNCEFKLEVEEHNGLKSGFHNCFKKDQHWGDADFKEPNIFDIWDFKKGSNLFDKGIIFKKDLSPEMIDYKVEPGKLSRTERQWIQIEKDLNRDQSIQLEVEGLKEEMNTWRFPLNFIDFETSASALPFHEGRSPYESIAFQFSHHILHADGRIEHASEFINGKAGEFPNFKFIRELKKSLDENDGTIFKFSDHENTIVNKIHEQLLESDINDKDELLAFIESISHSTRPKLPKWKGERDMIDLNKVIKDYYYNPLTKGSNSLKYVLPAILSSSNFLKKKYSQPLKRINVSSHNFDPSHVWLNIVNGEVKNPYSLLPPIFNEWTDDMIEESISEMEDLDNGGAALIAYGKLQYVDMTDEERKEIIKALLRYCELDTLAMVMVYEHFKELIR